MEQKEEVIEISSLTLPDPITKYDITPAKVAELAKKYDGLKVIPDDKKSYKDCTSAKMELVHTRTAVDKRRKELNDEAQKYIKNVNAAAKQLLEPLAPVEERLKAELKAEDDRLEVIESEKIRKDQERIEKIRKTIEGIKGLPLSVVGKSAAEIQDKVDLLSAWELTPGNFQEFTDEAQGVKTATLEAINALLLKRLEWEQGEVERKAEAERLEKIRLEQEAEAQRIEESRKAQEEEQRRIREEHEAKVRADDERIADERRKIEEEKARIEAEKKAEQERKDREEFERRAIEEARIKAEQDAKEKAEREERERIEREETERIERERQEALRPDKEKLLYFADKLATVSPPTPFATEEAADVYIEIDNKLAGLIAELRKKANEL